jgi:hypothetical protein
MKNIIFLRVKKNRDVCDVTLKEPGILNGGIPLVFFFYFFIFLSFLFSSHSVFLYSLFFYLYAPLKKRRRKKPNERGEDHSVMYYITHTKKRNALLSSQKEPRGTHTEREREKKMLKKHARAPVFYTTHVLYSITHTRSSIFYFFFLLLLPVVCLCWLSGYTAHKTEGGVCFYL